MPSTELFWTFLIAISLLTITPGVDTLLVMRNTARGGLKDGVMSSFGICSGLFVHATLSAVGISLILLQTAWAFALLKWVGAAYLVWLGVAACARLLARKPITHLSVTSLQRLRRRRTTTVHGARSVKGFCPMY